MSFELRNFGSLNADCGVRIGSGAGGEFECPKNPQFSIRDPKFDLRIADLGANRMKKELEARTKRFALSVIELAGKMPRGKASDVVGYQLLKSGTSIGANYREANRAQSHDDFIHKVAICEKEAAETEYWLELALEAKLTESSSTEELLREVRELLAIFVAS